MRDALQRWQAADATVKVDWALSSPIPWTDPAVAPAGTVHLADSLDEMSLTTLHLATGHVPAKPFLLVGQMTTADPTRSPAGTESAWAYTHVPQRIRGDAGPDGIKGVGTTARPRPSSTAWRTASRRTRPGSATGSSPATCSRRRTLEAADANLVGGDVNGGTAQLHQQFVFRPIGGLGRAETPVPGLYLASASAHPGGGVHGACGANAARAALWHARFRRR